MTLATFQELYLKLCDLQQALHELSVSAAEDKPLRGDVVLADRLCDATAAAQGWVAEAVASAQTACQAAAHPADWEAVQQCLGTSQEAFHRFSEHFVAELAHYERLAELVQLGLKRGGEWRAWTDIVKDNIERCHHALPELTRLYLRGWQELAGQLSKGSVSVKTTSIGQQINRAATEWPAELRAIP